MISLLNKDKIFRSRVRARVRFVMPVELSEKWHPARTIWMPAFAGMTKRTRVRRTHTSTLNFATIAKKRKIYLKS
jgi:hypothetical protein